MHTSDPWNYGLSVSSDSKIRMSALSHMIHLQYINADSNDNSIFMSLLISYDFCSLLFCQIPNGVRSLQVRSVRERARWLRNM